jgi:hypothetical protein
VGVEIESKGIGQIWKQGRVEERVGTGKTKPKRCRERERPNFDSARVPAGCARCFRPLARMAESGRRR